MNQIQTADYKLQFKQQKDSVRFFFLKIQLYFIVLTCSKINYTYYHHENKVLSFNVLMFGLFYQIEVTINYRLENFPVH